MPSRNHTVDAALDVLPRLADEHGPRSIVDWLRSEHRWRRHRSCAVRGARPTTRSRTRGSSLRLALLRERRRILLRLREDVVSDDLLLRVQTELDVEELAPRGVLESG